MSPLRKPKEPLKPHKAPRGQAERLKIDMSWEDAAGKLIATPAKSTPRRTVKTRRKKP